MVAVKVVACLCLLVGFSLQVDVKSGKDAGKAGNFMEDEQWLSTISQYSPTRCFIQLRDQLESLFIRATVNEMMAMARSLILHQHSSSGQMSCSDGASRLNARDGSLQQDEEMQIFAVTFLLQHEHFSGELNRIFEDEDGCVVGFYDTPQFFPVQKHILRFKDDYIKNTEETTGSDESLSGRAVNGLGLCDIQFQIGIDHTMRKVEDTVLFPSQSISGKEDGIEPFNSRKIKRNTGGEEGQQAGRVEDRKEGNEGDKDGVSVFVSVDTTKDPCQNVKCSRHKVCVAQGYQRAMCVNRKKLEHRVKQSGQLEAHDSSCKPCPVAASSPVCGSDGHNYASEINLLLLYDRILPP
ncbi:hypothetical protein PAMA_012374 [Pampus argenteus]